MIHYLVLAVLYAKIASQSETVRTASPLDILTDGKGHIYSISRTPACLSAGFLGTGLVIQKFSPDSPLISDWIIPFCPSSNQTSFEYVSADFNIKSNLLFVSFRSTSDDEFFIRTITANGELFQQPIQVTAISLPSPFLRICTFSARNSRATSIFLMTSSSIHRLIQIGNSSNLTVSGSAIINSFAGKLLTSISVVNEVVVVLGIFESLQSTGNTFVEFIALDLSKKIQTLPLPSGNSSLVVPRSTGFRPSTSINSSTPPNSPLMLQINPLRQCGNTTYIVLSSKAALDDVIIFSLLSAPPTFKINSQHKAGFNGDTLVSLSCIMGDKNRGIGMLFTVESDAGSVTSGKVTQSVIFYDKEDGKVSSPVLVSIPRQSNVANPAIFNKLQFTITTVLQSSIDKISMAVFGYDDSFQTATSEFPLGPIGSMTQPFAAFMSKFGTFRQAACPNLSFLDATTQECFPCLDSSKQPECLDPTNTSITVYPTTVNSEDPSLESNQGLSVAAKIAIGLFVPLFIFLIAFFAFNWIRNKYSNVHDDRKQQPSKHSYFANKITISKPSSNFTEHYQREIMTISSPTLISSTVLERPLEQLHTLVPISPDIPETHHKQPQSTTQTSIFTNDHHIASAFSKQHIQQQQQLSGHGWASITNAPTSRTASFNYQTHPTSRTASLLNYQNPIINDENKWTHMPNSITSRANSFVNLQQKHQNDDISLMARSPTDGKPIGTEDLESLIQALDERDRFSRVSRAISLTPSWNFKPKDDFNAAQRESYRRSKSLDDYSQRPVVDFGYNNEVGRGRPSLDSSRNKFRNRSEEGRTTSATWNNRRSNMSSAGVLERYHSIERESAATKPPIETIQNHHHHKIQINHSSSKPPLPLILVTDSNCNMLNNNTKPPPPPIIAPKPPIGRPTTNINSFTTQQSSPPRMATELTRSENDPNYENLSISNRKYSWASITKSPSISRRSYDIPVSKSSENRSSMAEKRGGRHVSFDGWVNEGQVKAKVVESLVDKIEKRLSGGKKEDNGELRRSKYDGFNFAEGNGEQVGVGNTSELTLNVDEGSKTSRSGSVLSDFMGNWGK